MGREHKFRVWDKINKEWHYYDMLREMDVSNYYNNFVNYTNMSMYTCHKDKERKEIYEGDILSKRRYRDHIEDDAKCIIWCNSEIQDNMFMIGFNYVNQSGTNQFCNPSGFEIIGNIHENKELLG